MKVQLTVKNTVVLLDVHQDQVDLLRSALLSAPRKTLRPTMLWKDVPAKTAKPKAKHVRIPLDVRRKAMKMAKEIAMATGKSVSMGSCIKKLMA